MSVKENYFEAATESMNASEELVAYLKISEWICDINVDSMALVKGDRKLWEPIYMP